MEGTCSTGLHRGKEEEEEEEEDRDATHQKDFGSKTDT